jgi:hypothetical protein
VSVIVFPGKIFIGHIGLFVRQDGSGDFPVDENWRHDLIAPQEATRIMLEGIRDGGGGWPVGFRHVYLNASREGGHKVEINFYDCACEKAGRNLDGREWLKFPRER